MRVLSGIQPSGIFHLGNYFGMIRKMIEYQEKAELFCFIANLHAMTTVFNGSRLARDTLEAATTLLSLGLDPTKSTFWVQSDVPEVTQLTWILSNLTPVGLLGRCHSYKDKVAKGIAANHGLLSYPVLMAADILLYKTEIVPVGKDQKQHVEIARDLAIKFNHAFGDVFIIPEPEIDKSIAVIPGTDGRKMSKSYGNTIDIFCEKDILAKHLMGIVTDSSPVEAPKNPDRCNLFKLYSLFVDTKQKHEMKERYLSGGLKYSDVKKELTEIIWQYFFTAREKRDSLSQDPGEISRILKRGTEKARDIASKTMAEVQAKTGVAYWP